MTSSLGSVVHADGSLPTLTRAHSVLIRNLLHDKKIRRQEGAFVVEGAKSCLDVIRWHAEAVLSLAVSPQYLRVETEANRKIRSTLRCRQFMCSDAIFEKLSNVETPQGMLAVIRQPHWDQSHLFAQSRVFGIYGDCIRDPANLGAIIRTAAAMRLSGIWLSADSVDHFSPKVVRAAAGTVLVLPVFYIPHIQSLVSQGCEIYSAVLPSVETIPIRSIVAISRRMVIAVGNEGVGLSADVVAASRVKFSIPLAQHVESLNVAATVAISTFHLSALPVEGVP